MSEQVISTQRLGRRYQRNWALAHVTLQVTRGETVALTGANGSGKTTLLHLLAGLDQPTRGTVEIFGATPSDAPVFVRRRVCLVSHRTFLYNALTAGETLQLWSRLIAADRHADGETKSEGELDELLASVDLAGRKDDRVGTFSQGMRKRLSLLRTKLEQPELVLLDEPFAALDPPGQRLVAEWINDLSAVGGTVVMASHDLGQAEQHCTRGLVLAQGQLVWDGPASELSNAWRQL